MGLPRSNYVQENEEGVYHWRRHGSRRLRILGAKLGKLGHPLFHGELGRRTWTPTPPLSHDSRQGELGRTWTPIFLPFFFIFLPIFSWHFPGVDS